MRVRALTTLAAASGIAVSYALAQQQATTTPGREWPHASPASLGVNAAVLDSLDAEIKAGNYGYIDRMLVIRHGKVAFDGRYLQDYAKEVACRRIPSGRTCNHCRQLQRPEYQRSIDCTRVFTRTSRRYSPPQISTATYTGNSTCENSGLPIRTCVAIAPPR